MMLRTTTGTHSRSNNGYTSIRPAILGLAKILALGLSQLSMASAAPMKRFPHIMEDEPSADEPSLWIYLTTAFILVLLGGAFAGLTIALMGQDGIYLQVIATSGEGKEQRYAQKVYQLLKRGKHWVLVTLLLSNVIVNETLPIVLDRSLGGGWPAVLGSTVLIVIFGEIIPQSVCVRYGLQIGAFMAQFVLILMYILAPIAWPTAKLLDWVLGEDEGTVYKKSGLKTLVTLHKTLGSSPGDRLNQDEVTIISAVLDLKDKPVGDIMTPMEDVFTMSADTILDEKTMDIILSAGYSRIPIHAPDNDTNFVGMLLVKILITYDPEDCKRVNDFALATLPETRPETSCLDIVNFFQEGKSHMVLVSEYPGEDRGAIGVVTLEDVIEELIGEEIIDESDVYIDVHKAIRRLAPAPKARVPKGQIVTDPDAPAIPEDTLIEVEDEDVPDGKHRDRLGSAGSRGQGSARAAFSPKTTFTMRRTSTGQDSNKTAPIAIRGTATDLREHLKHLGPSNLASRPKTTRYNTVKIKRGNIPDQQSSIAEAPYRDNPASENGENEGLLKSAGREASDGVSAVQRAYGTTDKGNSQSPGSRQKPPQWKNDEGTGAQLPTSQSLFNEEQASDNSDTMGSLPSGNSSPLRPKRRPARSGSITENIVDAGGVRKVVLETNSSSDDPDAETKHDGGSHSQLSLNGNYEETVEPDGTGLEDHGKRKQNRRRRKRKGGSEGQGPTKPSGGG